MKEKLKKRNGRKAYNVRLPLELHQALRIQAIRQRVSVNDLIVEALEEARKKWKE